MVTAQKEYEVIEEMMKLLEKTGFDSFALSASDALEESWVLDNILVTLKVLNARYDKPEAIAQINALMGKFNIQLDELQLRG